MSKTYRLDIKGQMSTLATDKVLGKQFADLSLPDYGVMTFKGTSEQLSELIDILTMNNVKVIGIHETN